MKSVASVLGRALIVGIFLMSALGNKIPNFAIVSEAMRSEGIPMPRVALVGAIAFLIVGSLLVLAGYQIQIGASLLFVFLALATFYFHDFWNFEGDEQQHQTIQFLKNVSMMGTFMFLFANGAGAMSVDQTIIADNEQ